MDVWDGDRHRRVREVLAAIELPPGARVLDFGCGSGALTALLRERWPDAEIHGADISRTAVASAHRRVPGVTFHVLDAAFANAHAGRFDFVFSHHVLEHVFWLAGTVKDLVALLSPRGRMLHVLPCGNAGSLAHRLCRQRPDGVDAQCGNRFFFEESSHLRRLRSDELGRAFAGYGCEMIGAAYGYHWHGVLRLMTEMPPPSWFAMVNPRRCHAASLPFVLPMLLLVAAIAALRAPAQVLLRCRRVWRQVFRYRTRRLTQPSTMLLAALALPAAALLPVSLPIEAFVRWLDGREWRRRRADPGGSEMFLQFASTAGGSAAPVASTATGSAAAVDMAPTAGKMVAPPSV
jgi:SAM-dependent methyltransferase